MSAKPLDRFYFMCVCGCGTASDDLGKNYIRLTQGLRWYAKDCAPKDKLSVGKPLGGGFVIREDDF